MCVCVVFPLVAWHCIEGITIVVLGGCVYRILDASVAYIQTMRCHKALALCDTAIPIVHQTLVNLAQLAPPDRADAATHLHTLVDHVSAATTHTRTRLEQCVVFLTKKELRDLCAIPAQETGAFPPQVVDVGLAVCHALSVFSGYTTPTPTWETFREHLQGPNFLLHLKLSDPAQLPPTFHKLADKVVRQVDDLSYFCPGAWLLGKWLQFMQASARIHAALAPLQAALAQVQAATAAV
jgi:hypothetical protein